MPPSSTFWHIRGRTRSRSASARGGARSSKGMLGSTILGFHTRFHCKNFIETVDRYLEARIEHEHSTISYQDEETLIESYPISIEWPIGADRARRWPPVAECRRRVFERLNSAGRHLPGGRRRPLRLHQGHPRAAARGRSACSKAPGVDAAASSSCRWPHRTRSELEEYRSVPANASQRVSDRINRALRHRGLSAGAPAGRSTTSATRSTSCSAPPTCAW